MIVWLSMLNKSLAYIDINYIPYTHLYIIFQVLSQVIIYHHFFDWHTWFKFNPRMDK